MPLAPECFLWPNELACAFWNRSPSIQGVTGPLRVEYTSSGTCTCKGTGNVQSHTASVQRCHLRQTVSYGLVNWCVRFSNHTPSVHGATGPPIFAYTAIFFPLDLVPTNVEPYKVCTNILVLPEFFLWLGELTFAFS